MYFPSSLTHTNVDFQAKLGIQTFFAEPIQFPAFVQLNGALHTEVAIGIIDVLYLLPALKDGVLCFFREREVYVPVRAYIGHEKEGECVLCW